GAFGILAAHVPTLQVLRPGLVVVHAEDGTTSKYFVSSGSIAVNADSSVQLLAEEAVTLDMLDLGPRRTWRRPRRSWWGQRTRPRGQRSRSESRPTRPW
ncbi:ATP5D isoform 4, partial [Pan troglodytes]